MSAEPFLCGRPTTTGRPCRQRLDTWQVACRQHATDEDLRHAARFAAEWRAQFQAGFQVGQASATCAECTARAAAAAQARLRYTQDGKQIAQFGKYAYVWDGDEPLAIGDRCLLPGNWLFKEPSEGVVTGLGTEYEGKLAHVLRLISRRENGGHHGRR